MKKINSKYISSIDKKMAEFNRTHKLTESQQAEHDKYQEIYKKRDQAVNPIDEDLIDWS